MGGGGSHAAAGAAEPRPEPVKRMWRVRPSLPVVEQVRVSLPDKDLWRLAALAESLRQRDPGLGRRPAEGLVRSGALDGPALLFEDHHEIPLFSDKGPSPLECRPRLLAADGDVLALAGPADPAFEDYARDVLRLGDVEVIDGLGAERPLPDSLAADPAARAALARLARRHGGLTVMPYLSTPSAWRLAGAVAGDTGLPVSVLGPTPALARRVNDKSWFSRRVVEVLGPDALPETRWAANPAELADRVAGLAKNHSRVVVKLPESAGGVGNVVLDSDAVVGLDPDALLAVVWRGTGRGGRGWSFPLLVSAWSDPVIDSPSVQLWIPLRGEGLPVCEGVFSQVLRGARGSFVGAAPTWLPETWRQRIADEGVRLGYLLQELGYFGRASFDAVLSGTGLEAAALHWVDGNGRWGGVSIAMTGANRLAGDWQRRPFVIVQRANLSFPARPLADVVEALGAKAFRPADGRTGAVILAPRRLGEGTGLNLMVMAADQDSAALDAVEVAAILTGPAEESQDRSAVA